MMNLMTVRKREVLLLCGVGTIVLWVGSTAFATLPADPENAASLYYQAALRLELYKPPYPSYPSSAVSLFVRGYGSEEQVRDYLDSRIGQGVVVLVENAARIPHCDWGFMYSLGWVPDSFATSLGRLGLLLAAKARIQAVDGQYRAALETCLTLRRFAAHAGDTTDWLWGVSGDAHRRSLLAVRDVLGGMPADASLLTWIKDELTHVPAKPWHPKAALKHFAELEIQGRKMLPHEYEGRDKERFLKGIKDEAVREEMRRLNESELLERALRSFEEFLDAAVEIMDRDIPLNEQWKQLCLLDDRYKQRLKQGDPIYFLGSWISATVDLHEAQINHVAISNALMSAIEIYLVKAQTGQLPQELPAGLPDDPYSGQRFDYEITETGFLLRCLDIPSELCRGGVREFEFTVGK